MLCGNSLQALKSETRKCKDALKVTKSKSCVLEGTPPSSWDVSPRHQEKEPFAKWQSALFMLLSLLYSRHETAFLLLADEDNEQLWWSSNILMPPQIFEWFVIGGNDLGQPQNHCSLHLDGSSHTGPRFSPSQSVQPSQCLQKLGLLEPPLAKMWHVYQRHSLHTVTRRHINTDAHANTNTNTHCLCVSLSGQIRKTWHYLFGVPVYQCMPTHTSTFLSMCEHT